MDSVTVRVPATTANLAAGFDTLGCALSLYNTLRFTLSDHLCITGCDPAYQNADNLAVQAFAAVYSRIGQPMPAVRIDIAADIPVSRGLGSSAALLAAGAMAANALSAAQLPMETLLALTTRIEGHPDNLAPALFGGLTASFLEEDQVYIAQYAPHPDLHFVAVSPDFPLSTHAARAVLPANVPYGDAVYNGAHLAVLLRALETGDEPLIAASLRDRLHQPYRIPLIAEYEAVRALTQKNGCRAFCISGAGPTLLCVTRDASFAPALKKDLVSLRHRWEVRNLRADTQGAQILQGCQ